MSLLRVVSSYVWVDFHRLHVFESKLFFSSMYPGTKQLGFVSNAELGDNSDFSIKSNIKSKLRSP